MSNEKLANELSMYLELFAKRHLKNAEKTMQGELAVLRYLSKGECEPTEISTHFKISAGRVTNILTALEKKKFIVREHSIKDRRKVIVKITEIGKAKVKTIHNNMVGEIKELLVLLGENDSNELVRIMKKISEIIEFKERC